jgi:hypothetical protein
MGKIAPEYKGVDPKAQPYIKEFKELAKMQGIEFKHEVTVGFKKLPGDTIGLTSYGPFDSFREIDLDPDWFNSSTELSRLSLVLHESDHAFCDRGHDWGNGVKYPEYSDWKGREPIEGHYPDHCALSLMYPVIVDDFCMLMHFTEYSQELFNRCDPY